MGKLTTELSMSLDGFVAGPNDSPELPLGEGGEKLFEWYYSGDTPLPLPGTDMVFKISSASAELLNEEWATLGAMVAGRRMFDIASIMQECIKVGLLDEIHINLVPVLLGGGVRMFDRLDATPLELESTRIVEAPGVTHLRFRVVR
jgi:dihydrofolate reductase